jgi:HD superfamily phosphohydrolase
MTALPRPQRIRDPVHNLIEFGTDDFESTLWRVIQSQPFQRLRRIRQLGFSEFVYPGATHTRFSHSIGVFHLARRLMNIIKVQFDDTHHQYSETWAKVAMAAALVHDLGHGMFSHAFEEVGKEIKKKHDVDLKLVKHELVTAMLIRDSEISEILTSTQGSGFAADVAQLIGRGSQARIYDAVVSSQFDADRLDYMQRDRMMTGVQSSGIDLTWLLSNLETGSIDIGVDGEKTGAIDTFVLGSKAILGAETYVLGLFQLYPTVYFHKATRGAEKIFTALMVRLVTLVQEGETAKTGLPPNHPFARFAMRPDELDNAQKLDNTVFWGALPLLIEASDPLISHYASRLAKRELLKCVDIREAILKKLPIARDANAEAHNARGRRVARLSEEIRVQISEWNESKQSAIPRVLIDSTSRNPYKTFQDSHSPLNQIHIRVEGGRIVDIAERSKVVAGLETFVLQRAYIDRQDNEAENQIGLILDSAISTGGKTDG